MKKSITTYLLIILICFQSISAVPSGWMMFTDPSGATLGISLEMLKNSPFPNFLVPGMFLFIFLGLFPILIVYGLIKKPKFKWAERINLFKNQHWAWTFSYYLGVLLILWINMQLLLLKEYFFLQVVYSMLGILLIFLTHLPSTKKDYGTQNK